jgi:hypothetical protein
MDGSHSRHAHRTVAPAAFLEFPELEGMPVRLLGGAVFKGSILDQLRVQPAVGGVVQILEENPKQIGTDGFARLARLDRNGRRLCVGRGSNLGQQSGKAGGDELGLKSAMGGAHGR